MKKVKLLALTAVFATSMVAVPAAMADVAANVGVVTNYIWRGVSQTSDGPAVQGGVDWEHESGFYLGTWMSNVDFGGLADNNEVELDLYGGYGGTVGEVDWDAGLIYYAYPLTDDVNFLEIYGAGTWKWLSFGLNYTVSGDANSPSAFRGGDYYLFVAGDWDLGNDWGVGATIGAYDFDDLSSSSANPDGTGNFGDYNHLQGRVTKGDFILALDINDLEGKDVPGGKDNDDPRIWVGYTKEF
jgi:uncharacterized protein (TIGR02001 family)